MQSPFSCPSCGRAFALGEATCPRDGTPAPGFGRNPDATMLDSEDDEAVVLEPTLIRKRSDVGPAATMDEEVVPSERTQKWDPLVGARLGEYVVEERIGTGGMGIVYRGRQPEIGKAVAIKVLRPEIADDPEQVKRLLAEARAVNAIGHRGIIDIFSFGRLPDGRQYFVMELLSGVALDEKMARVGKMPTDEIITLLDDMLSALGAAHAAGVIHRDLKPSNLFLVSQPDGSTYLKLLDFGLARQSAIPGASTPQTRNVAVGTAEYMAPEQARGLEVGPFTDLYSLGVVAYEMVTGQLPLTGASPVETMIAHLEKVPARPSVHTPEVAPELEDLIMRLLAKEPKDRPQTADAVRRELKRLSQGLRAHLTQPAAKRAPEAPAAPVAEAAPRDRPSAPNPVHEMASALMAADLAQGGRATTAPHQTRQEFEYSPPPVAGEAMVPRRTPSHGGATPKSAPAVLATLTSAPAYQAPKSSRLPLIVTAVAVALTLALGLARYLRAPTPGPVVPSVPAAQKPTTPPVPAPAVQPAVPPVVHPVVDPIAAPPPAAEADAGPAVKVPEPAAVEPKAAALTKKPRPAVAKHGAPTQTALLERIEELRRDLARATPKGEDPDPTALALLTRAANQARGAADEPGRRKISAFLDEVQRKYIAH